jgi:two-component system invasion response regulator UvrY
MTTVLIADDYPVARAGLRQLLEEETSITEVGEAAAGSETFDKLQSAKWNLLILGINLPDHNGLELLRHIRADHPDTTVLVHSDFPERQYGMAVLRAGAASYVRKDCASETLLTAVRSLLQGRRHISPSLAELLLAGQIVDSGRPLHSFLSKREFQVFCKIAAGRTVSSLACELSLSTRTVSTHRKRILKKMGLTSNAELTTYAFRNAIIPYDASGATSGSTAVWAPSRANAPVAGGSARNFVR